MEEHVLDDVGAGEAARAVPNAFVPDNDAALLGVNDDGGLGVGPVGAEGGPAILEDVDHVGRGSLAL